MANQARTTVVVGGGIAGLLSALLARLKEPATPVVVVEQAPEVGGLLGKVDGGEFGLFDLGMHTMTQTGCEPLDQLLWTLLPEDEWHVFGGKLRDVSGTFYNGQLQRHAHYPDLRSLPAADHDACLVDLLAHLQKKEKPAAGPDMRSFAEARFGREIAQRVIEPLMQRTYARTAAQISTLAAVLLRLDRVVLFDEPFFRELMGSPSLRQVVAYPEQRHLDLAFSSGRGSYYPRNFGIYRVIDALVERCRESGVRFFTGSKVRQLLTSAGKVESIALSTLDEPLKVKDLLWSAGVIPLAQQLGVFPAGLPSDPPLTTAVVNFLFDHPTEMGDLYYFYCLDKGFRTYRVTNFTAYCPGAPRAGGWPICVELILLPGHTTDSEALKEQALRELRGFGVLPSWAETLFAHTRVLERGFPLPSVANMELITASRQAVRDLGLENVEMLGVLSKPGLFFQTDVVRDVYETLMGAHVI